jgi:hypothetical protein
VAEAAARACTVLALALVLAGCGVLAEQAPGALVVRHAALERGGGAALLALELDCRLSGPMQDALDHGIPLTLAVDLRAGSHLRPQARAQPRIELRWFPLSRRYQLREIGSEDVRSFATRATLVAALGALRIGLPPTFAQLPPGTPLEVSVALDPGALPGALRLPALFEPAWQLSSPGTRWLAGAP